ncbi:unnamed protein product [Rodentolepis nana]|uniref:Myb-like domain-containing protein n=1 Tax=Rodentolepis nana TaxID=102285 RepID=A0A0R3TYB5_RODNA|nr:unnamed protein product [Rodentolepis nana]
MVEWSKCIPKIMSPVTEIVNIYVPSDKRPSEDVKLSGSIPFHFLYTQLQEFATNKDPGTHPSTWFDDDAFKSRITAIKADYERRKKEKSILSDSGLISSWVNSLSSFECLESGAASASVSVQTDGALGLSICPQSTPNKESQTKSLLPQGMRTFLDDDDSFILDVSTPSGDIFDPPHVAARKTNTDVENLGNVSLPILNDSDSSVHRRRIPWTLSETIALWHEVQEALPNPPSWANIRDKVFASSRRTNVDLKDRWRVIQRDKGLQKKIRLYYDKWLAGQRKSSKK